MQYTIYNTLHVCLCLHHITHIYVDDPLRESNDVWGLIPIPQGVVLHQRLRRRKASGIHLVWVEFDPTFVNKCTECITILSNFDGDGWALQMVFGLDGKSFFLGHSAARTRAWGLQCATPGVERCVMACHIAVTVSMCLHVHLFQLSIILGSS